MKSRMERIHYLAAEIFFYSYDNYDGHLGIGGADMLQGGGSGFPVKAERRAA